MRHDVQTEKVEGAPVGVENEPGAVRALVTAANAVLALYPHDDQLWTLESAVRPFNAARPPAEAQAQGGGEPVACKDIPDWAIARSYRKHVDALDPQFRIPSALIFACDVTVEADRMARTAPPSAAVGVEGGLSRSLKLAAAEEQAEAWQAVCTLLSEMRPGWAIGPGTGLARALDAIRTLAQQPAPSAPVGVEGWALTKLRAHEARCDACGRAVWDGKDQGNCIGFLAPCGKRVARVEDCGTADCIAALAQQPAAVDEAIDAALRFLGGLQAVGNAKAGEIARGLRALAAQHQEPAP